MALMNNLAVYKAKMKKHYSLYGAYIFLAWAALMIVGVLLSCVLFKTSPHQAFGYLDNWDGGAYLRIAENGYPDLKAVAPNDGNNLVAFFPLYPLLIAVISTITFLPASVVGLLISWISFFIAIQLLLHLLVKVWKFDKSTSKATVALLVLNPFSVFFGMVYTESLFLAISTFAFILLARKNYLLAALMAGLASSLRVTGIIIGVIVILFYILTEHRSLVRALTKIQTYWITALSVSGFVMFTLFLYLRTGDSLAFIHVQSSFGRHFNLSGFIADFHTIIDKFGTYAIWPYTLIAAIIFAVLTLVAAVWLYRKHPPVRPYSLFMIASTVVPLSSGTFTSINRYNMIFIGLYLGLMSFVKGNKIRIAIILLSSIVMLGFVMLMCHPSRPMIG